MNALDIDLNYRFIETVQPGFFFGDTYEMKWPKESWTNVESLAKELAATSNMVVGFKRFIYDPSYGKRYFDKGWVYFKGRKFTMDDCLSGKAKQQCPSIPLTQIAIDNIRNNKFDCLYLEDYGKLWPLEKDDLVI